MRTGCGLTTHDLTAAGCPPPEPACGRLISFVLSGQMTRSVWRLALALAMLLSYLGAARVDAQVASEDVAIPNGRVFPQSGGYAIADEAGVPLWSEYQRLGGIRTLGYPISARYQVDGFVTQAMQKGILQWRPEQRQAVLTNVLDDLSRAGRDDWLLSFRQTPKPLPPDFDAGRSWPETVQRRQGLLDADPAIKSRYFAVADPIALYGLPTSQVQDMGNHLAVRLQRAVIQRWKVDVPWARAGDVTVANAGELARDGGLLSAAALKAPTLVLEGRSERTPWSGWWWPADDGVVGPHLYDRDGPLARYDRLTERLGRPTSTRQWELANVYLTGGQYVWAGHCNGWAAASILEPEPTTPKTIAGVTFSVADQKGLLSSWHFADNVEWSFGDDERGVNPADFHRAVVQWLGGTRKPFIVNAAANAEQVFNFPAYRYRVVYGPDPTDPAKTHVRTTLWFVDYNVDPNMVGTKSWPNDDGRTYEYDIVGDRNNPSGGAWEGASATGAAFSRPWRIWYPDPRSRNDSRPLTAPELDYAIVRGIVDVKQ